MMNKSVCATIGLSAVVVIAVGFVGLAKSMGEPGEQERRVQVVEVPAPALAALKKLTKGARITAFSEEIEHGQTYYEGSWNTADGQIDVLVTSTGDLVEIEQTVPAGKVPKPVLRQARAAAGKKAKLRFEKKTIIMYEVHFRKSDRGHELVLSPDGRQQGHEEEQGDVDEND